MILGIEALRANQLMPISREAVSRAKDVATAKDRQMIGNALSAVILYSIVVELVIKHIWEVEHKRSAEHTHNVLGLFKDLDSATQGEITRIYDECCPAYEEAVRVGVQQLGDASIQVEIANINEALEWNESAMKNFKYDLTPQGKSVPNGLFWSSDTIWKVPDRFPNFAVKLTRWAGG